MAVGTKGLTAWEREQLSKEGFDFTGIPLELIGLDNVTVIRPDGSEESFLGFVVAEGMSTAQSVHKQYPDCQFRRDGKMLDIRDCACEDECVLQGRNFPTQTGALCKRPLR